MTYEGNLLTVDQDSAQETRLAEFSHTPFILNGEQDVGGYELAYDDSLNMLFILLGDSRQLVAIQEK